jgi:hypothetical protein
MIAQETRTSLGPFLLVVLPLVSACVIAVVVPSCQFGRRVVVVAVVVVVVVNGHPVLLSIFVVRVVRVVVIHNHRVVVIHNHRVVVSCTTPYVVVVSKKIINKCTKPYLLPLDLNPPCHPSPAIVCRPYPSFVDVVICT